MILRNGLDCDLSGLLLRTDCKGTNFSNNHKGFEEKNGGLSPNRLREIHSTSARDKD
jgi:hypothetical protein